ncbi:MAG: hypothetical protein H6819_08415 [Phycisphaerales bacterium]|nr:hypothetical protein [Phycisphaerales bacterium]MCB9854171.1 hypothetical protein [Phycisphaerales bacterium]MCB9864693.1 hypothetical protein [Phycisphaerales bacterium]
MNTTYHYPQPQGPVGQGVTWYTRPTTIGVFLVAICALIFVPSAEYRSAVIFGAFNFALICFFCVRFVRHRKLSSLIPVLFFAWVALGWPLGTVIFGLASPDMCYDIPAGRRYVLDGNLRIQVVTLVFVVTYAATFFILRPRGAPDLPIRPPEYQVRRLLYVLLPICLGLTVSLAVVTVTMQQNAVSYVAFGLQKYIIGLYLVIGGCILYLRFPTLLFIAATLAGATLIFFVGNARGMAARPVVLIIAGVLFLSTVKDRTKLLMLLSVCIGMPLLLVIGNTTRTLSKTVGFTDFAYRLSLLTEWDKVLENSPIFTSTFGRLFSTGGHAIITNSPERVPFMAFEASKYGLEIVASLFVPGTIWFYAPYSVTTNLNNYGFHLIPGGHSVELSLIGSFWMIGGYVAVFLGAIATGMFHAALAHWINAAARRSILKGAIYLAGISLSVLWCQNLAFPDHLKVTIWAGAFMVLLYHLVLKPFSGLETPQWPVNSAQRYVQPIRGPQKPYAVR